MAEISSALKQYLGSLAGRRWTPGAMDCGVFMADWAKAVTGTDPIADVRGTYATVVEFERILAAEGGFLRACAVRLRRVGYGRTRTPSAGDIAAVMAPTLQDGCIVRQPTGAICVTDRLFAVMTSDLGIVIADRQALPLIRTFTYG